MRPAISPSEPPQDGAKKPAKIDTNIVLANSLPSWDLLPPAGMVVRRKKLSGE